MLLFSSKKEVAVTGGDRVSLRLLWNHDAVVSWAAIRNIVLKALFRMYKYFRWTNISVMYALCTDRCIFASTCVSLIGIFYPQAKIQVDSTRSIFNTIFLPSNIVSFHLYLSRDLLLLLYLIIQSIVFMYFLKAP